MFCQKCGKENSEQSEFCTNCGNRNSQSSDRPARPDNYIAWAIISTSLCCLPLGIVSIIKSLQVDNFYYNQGYYSDALQASHDAKKWAIRSVICMAIFCTVYLLIIAGGAVFAFLAL